MAEYTIKMADERGHVLEQIENGASEAEIRDRFAQQGYFVYSIKSKGLLSGEVDLPRRRKVKQDQFVIFNQQFVTLIHAGLPIIQSLELLIKRQRNVFFRPSCRMCATACAAANCCQTPSRRRAFFPRFTPPRCWQARRAATLRK